MSMRYGKFVFDGEELQLDELELVQLMKLVKARNKRLWIKFKVFYESVDNKSMRFIYDMLGLK